MAVYFKGEIIKEWDIVRGLQVNGHSDISQYQWHTRSQSGSIPSREPKDHGQLFVMLQDIHASPCNSPQRLGAGSKANSRPALLQASHCLRRKVRARNIDRYCTYFKSKTH